jgi:hypothetical protein
MKKRLGIKGVVKHEGLVEGLILFLREERVLLDADLATIYGVTTKALNQAVKRNAERFPKDFMFQLSDVEKQEVVTNCDHLSRLKYSKARPYAFTEHGALMVANVLRSRAFFRKKQLTMGPIGPLRPAPPILVSRSATDGNAACAGELDLGNELLASR